MDFSSLGVVLILGLFIYALYRRLRPAEQVRPIADRPEMHAVRSGASLIGGAIFRFILIIGAIVGVALVLGKAGPR